MDVHSAIRSIERILGTEISYSALDLNVSLGPFQDDNIDLEKNDCEMVSKLSK